MEKDHKMTKESKEALLEFHKSRVEEKCEKRKQFVKVIGWIVLIIILIKLFFGIISIPTLVTMKDRRKLEVTIGNEKPVITVDVIKRIPIIPHLVELKGFWFSTFSSQGPNYVTVPITENESVPFSIASYACQTELDGKIYDMECKDGADYQFILKEDVKYQLLIRSDYGTEYYRGDMIENIRPYLSEKEYRVIEIFGHYGNVDIETAIHVKLELKDT